MCTVECTEGGETGPEYKMQVGMSLCLNCESRCVSLATCSTNMRHKAATCLQLVLASGHLLKQLSSGTYFSRQVEGRPCAGKDKIVKNFLVTRFTLLTYSTYLVTSHPHSDMLSCMCLDTKLGTCPDGRLLQTTDILFHPQLKATEFVVN